MRLDWRIILAGGAASQQGDIDNDGDIDYVVTNLGLNTRYQPSPAEPCQIIYGDFAGNGDAQIVESQVTPSGLLPVRGMSAFEKVIPNLRAKYPTHHLYAAATLTELLGGPALETAFKLNVNTAESCVLRNDGRGVFKFEPLPRLAQIAPSHGLALADVDADGNLDLLLAQNSYNPQRETGRMDGGAGLLLMGSKEGIFVPVWPNQSGVIVAADARSLTTCDLNGDGWVDFLVGVNNGEIHAFENTIPKTNRALCLKLQGQGGNPTAVGAQVTVHLKNGGFRTAEMLAGSGYLSQSDSALRFGLGTTGEVDRVEVRWPRGKSTTHQVRLQGNSTVLREE